MSNLQSILQNAVSQWEKEVKNSTTEWVRNRGQYSISCLIKTTSVVHKVKFVYQKISKKHSTQEIELADVAQLKNWLKNEECLYSDKHVLLDQLLQLIERLIVDCPCEECTPQMWTGNWQFY